MSTIFAPASEPLDIDFLVLPEVSLLSLAATIEPLRAANRVAGREPLPAAAAQPRRRGPVTTSGGLPIPVEAQFSPDEVRDAWSSSRPSTWLTHATPAAACRAPPRRAARRRHRRGRVGIAGAGDGGPPERSPRHHALGGSGGFRGALSRDRRAADRYVIDGARFTTGGASPALDLMLHLIRARHGHALALDVASIFIYDELRAAGDPQPMVSLGRLGWNEPRVAAAIRIMEERIERPIADSARWRRRRGSARGCWRRSSPGRSGCRRATIIARSSLNAGRRLVLETQKSMTEIAAQTGFASASAFARSFRGRFGESPRAARVRRRAGSIGFLG